MSFQRILYAGSRDKKCVVLFEYEGQPGTMELEVSSPSDDSVQLGLSQFVHFIEHNGKSKDSGQTEKSSSNRPADIASLYRDGSFKQIFRNDKWSSYSMQMLSTFKIDICHPASSNDILKKQSQRTFLVSETSRDYKDVIFPYLHKNEMNSSHNDWIINILNGISEKESIIKSSPDPDIGYVLLPDSKWDHKDLANLYLLCIVRRTDLFSLRDLSPKELPLLSYVKEEISIALKESFNVTWNDVKVFIHYLPTFYHLHIHIVSNSFDSPTLQIGIRYLRILS